MAVERNFQEVYESIKCNKQTKRPSKPSREVLVQFIVIDADLAFFDFFYARVLLLVWILTIRLRREQVFRSVALIGQFGLAILPPARIRAIRQP